MKHQIETPRPWQVVAADWQAPEWRALVDEGGLILATGGGVELWSQWALVDGRAVIVSWRGWRYDEGGR
jgi:hypothetical protein